MSTVFSPFPCDDKFRAESIAAYSAINGYTRMLQKCTFKLHITELLPCYRQNSVKPTLSSSFSNETCKFVKIKVGEHNDSPY